MIDIWKTSLTELAKQALNVDKIRDRIRIHDPEKPTNQNEKKTLISCLKGTITDTLNFLSQPKVAYNPRNKDDAIQKLLN